MIQHGLDAKHELNTNPSKSAFRYDKSSRQIYFVGDESTAILTSSSETISSFGGSGLEDEHDHSVSILPTEEPHHERSLLDDIVEYLENDDDSTVQTQTTCSKSSPDSNNSDRLKQVSHNEIQKEEEKKMDNSVISVNLANEFVSPLAIENGNFDKLKDEKEDVVEESHQIDDTCKLVKEEYDSFPIEQMGSSDSNFFYCSSSDSGDTNSYHQPYAGSLKKSENLERVDECEDVHRLENKNSEQKDFKNQSEIDILENISQNSNQNIVTTLDQTIPDGIEDMNTNYDSKPMSTIDGQGNDISAELGSDLDHATDNCLLSDNIQRPVDTNFDNDVLAVNETEMQSSEEGNTFENLEDTQTLQSENVDVELSPMSSNEISNARKEESYALFAEEVRLELDHLRGEIQEVLSNKGIEIQNESSVVKQNEDFENTHLSDVDVTKSNNISVERRQEEVLRDSNEELRKPAEEKCLLILNDDLVSKIQLQLTNEDFDYLEKEIGNSMSSDTSPLVSPVSDNASVHSAHANKCGAQSLDTDCAGHTASPVRHHLKNRESSIPRISIHSPLKSNSPYKGDKPTKIPTPSNSAPRKDLRLFDETNMNEETRTPSKANLSFDSHDSSIPRIPISSPLRSRSPYRGERHSKIPTPSNTQFRHGLKLPSPASSIKNVKVSATTPSSQSIGVKTTTSASSAMSNFSEITLNSLPFDEAPVEKGKTRKNRVSNRNSQCSGNWEPYLFLDKRGCERCLSLATEAERDAFFQKGKHACVTSTCGGCHRLCNKYSGPRFYDDDAVHLCRLCFHATHSRNNVSRNLSTDYA